MRVTVKSIIKWGLIAEILTAIVGQAGEFALRYRAYSCAFDELFGHYRLHELSPAGPQEFELNPESMALTTPGSPSAAMKIDPNHKLYEHRAGRAMRMPPPSTQTPGATHSGNSTDKSTLATIFETAFRSSITSKPKSDSDSSLFSFESYSKSLTDIMTVPKPLDPRPLLVCIILVCLNLLFMIGIIYEYLPLICPLTIFWLLYLILVLLILHAGATTGTPTSSTTLAGQSPWATLTPSPFTILVVSIILVFSLILIGIVVEERRQIAMRIRAKSAAIPLVKSRDMDLDEI